MINTAGMIRTMEQTLLDLMTDEPACLRFVDRKNAVQLEVYRRMLEKARGKIDLLWLGEDLGTQRGPMISLELFRKQIRPQHQKFVDLAKSFGLPVMMHSCGSSSWAFEDFIDMGIKVVDTLQPEAKDMAPAYLKERYGASLSFHGCISTAGTVATGSVEDVVQGRAGNSRGHDARRRVCLFADAHAAGQLADGERRGDVRHGAQERTVLMNSWTMRLIAANVVVYILTMLAPGLMTAMMLVPADLFSPPMDRRDVHVHARQCSATSCSTCWASTSSVRAWSWNSAGSGSSGSISSAV